MTRGSRFAALGTVLVLVASARLASADNITITGGFLDVPGTLASFSLSGDRGFTMQGATDIYSGIFSPALQCSIGPCLPGTLVDLHAAWVGNDLPATVTLDGRSYTNVGSLSGDSSAFVDFSGGFVAPPLAAAALLQSPFTFHGGFYATDANVSLEGSGIASIWLREGLDGGWQTAEVRYDFGPARVVTPEPATLGLFATGLLLAATMMRRRRY